MFFTARLCRGSHANKEKPFKGKEKKISLVDYFFLLGEGEGGVRGARRGGGGDPFFIENPRRFRRGGGGFQSVANWGIFGGRRGGG